VDGGPTREAVTVLSIQFSDIFQHPLIGQAHFAAANRFVRGPGFYRLATVGPGTFAADLENGVGPTCIRKNAKRTAIQGHLLPGPLYWLLGVWAVGPCYCFYSQHRAVLRFYTTQAHLKTGQTGWSSKTHSDRRHFRPFLLGQMFRTRNRGPAWILCWDRRKSLFLEPLSPGRVSGAGIELLRAVWMAGVRSEAAGRQVKQAGVLKNSAGSMLHFQRVFRGYWKRTCAT